MTQLEIIFLIMHFGTFVYIAIAAAKSQARKERDERIGNELKRLTQMDTGIYEDMSKLAKEVGKIVKLLK